MEKTVLCDRPSLIKSLTQVDIEYLQLFRTIGHGIEKTVYRNAAGLIALRQRAETYGARVQAEELQDLFVSCGFIIIFDCEC